jgi:hypothetical protein
MRITHYRTMTDAELLNFAETRAETPLEVELLNRLNARIHGNFEQNFENQMTLVFGEPLK